MSVYDLFSKRKKRAAMAGQPDMYQYDDLPKPFRIQVIHIWTGAIGPWCQAWALIQNAVARELGLGYLGTVPSASPQDQCFQFVQIADTDHALDLIELSFRFIDTNGRKVVHGREAMNITDLPDEAIQELNHRFREHSIGYQYVAGQIIRIDSQHLHSEAVLPAIRLLDDHNFKAASDEFLEAHENYRHKRHKDAIVAAERAFESTLKVICDKRGWQYPKGATAAPLIQLVLNNGLIPEYLQGHLNALRSVLESGAPTVRNRSGGHGAGSSPATVSEHLAHYMLNLVASNIVLLVEAHRANP